MKLFKKATPWSGSARTRNRRGGFTFAEVLAALVVMAIVVPVAMEGLQIANRAGLVAHRKAVAIRLAESFLNEITVTEQWEGALQRGTFGDDYVGYEWRLENESWRGEALRLITVEVSYEAQGRQYTERLSTLVKPVSYQ